MSDDDNDFSISPGETGSFDIEKGKETIYRQNRPVRFELFLKHGTKIEGIIPANTDFKIKLEEGDEVRFFIYIEKIPNSPYSIN